MEGEFSIYETIEIKFENDIDKNFLDNLNSIDMEYEKSKNDFYIKDSKNDLNFHLEIKNDLIILNIKNDDLKFIKDIESRLKKCL